MTVPCTIENCGTESFVSAAPHPITVAYKWMRPGAEQDMIEIDHVHLPETLRPGQEVRFTLKITAPMEEGEFLLRVTLVQEQVRWFDEVGPSNACTQLVWIEHPDRSACEECGSGNGAGNQAPGHMTILTKDSDAQAT